MTIIEQLKETQKVINKFTALIDDIDLTIESIEQKADRTDTDEKLLQYAKHLQKIYQRNYQ